MEENTLEPQELDLRYYWQMLRKRRLTVAACLLAVVTLVMIFTLLQKNQYEAQTKILTKGSAGSSQADILSSTIPALGAFADQREIQTQVEIIKSWPILKEAAQRVGINVTDVDADKLPVKVDGGKDNNIISVTTTSENPRQAMDLANSVADVYVKRNLSLNRASAHLGRVFLEGQQERYRESLLTASKALRDYETRTGAVALDAATEDMVKALADTESQKFIGVAAQGAAEARLHELRGALSRTSPTIVAISHITVNPSVEKLQDEIADLTVQRAGLAKDYAPTSKKVTAVDAQIEQAQSRVKSLVANVVAGKDVAANPVQQTLLSNLIDAEGQGLAAAAQVRGLTRTIAAQRALLARLPEEQYRLAQLQRDVQVAEKTYLALQDRYQSLRIAEESTLANAQIIEPAVLPKGPVSPKRKLNFLIGVIVGLMVGVGVAAMQEAMDDTMRTGEDVERELALPLLGMVHNIDLPEDRSLLRAGTLSSIAEAIRLVRSNIKFLTVDRSLRTLMVTSASKGEGKSTTAANLAVALAQDGKKVTLVDGDLRRPNVHKQFGIPNVAGLTTAIVGGTPLSDVTVDVGVENLSVITAGPIPPNPAELLDSARFARLMEELRTTNDIVLFDAPPVLGVADASVLGGRIDGTVLVVAAGEVERKAARRTVQMLQQARATVLGVVLNKMDEQHGGYYNYYYYQYTQDDDRTGKRHKHRRNTATGGKK